MGAAVLKLENSQTRGGCQVGREDGSAGYLSSGGLWRVYWAPYIDCSFIVHNKYIIPGKQSLETKLKYTQLQSYIKVEQLFHPHHS